MHVAWGGLDAPWQAEPLTPIGFDTAIAVDAATGPDHAVHVVFLRRRDSADPAPSLVADVEAGDVQTPRGPLVLDDMMGVVAAALASGSDATFAEASFGLLNSLLGPAVDNSTDRRSWRCQTTAWGATRAGATAA